MSVLLRHNINRLGLQVILFHWSLCLGRAKKMGSRSHSPEDVHYLWHVPYATSSVLIAWIHPPHIISLPKMCVSGMSPSLFHSRPEDLVLEQLTKSPTCHMFILFVFCPPQ